MTEQRASSVAGVLLGDPGERCHGVHDGDAVKGFEVEQVLVAGDDEIGVGGERTGEHGIASVHPLRGPELRALRRLQRDYPETAYVFVSERKAPSAASA